MHPDHFAPSPLGTISSWGRTALLALLLPKPKATICFFDGGLIDKPVNLYIISGRISSRILGGQIEPEKEKEAEADRG